MSQAIENQLISKLLDKFEQDQSQATREVLELIHKDPENTMLYILTFNDLFSSKSNHYRQRRDVAAIARLIADSTIFTPLEQIINKQLALGRATRVSSLIIDITKLISNICNENPHFVDNILANRPSILSKLFQIYSQQNTTPNDPESITTILNFLHNVSLKETAMRTEKVGPCLQALLENLLSKDKFCGFISQKKFQNFIANLFKFHSNVNFVAHHVYYSLMKSARSLNSDYKKIAEMYKSASQRTAEAGERSAIMEAASFADKKLIAMMRLFQKAKGNIFARFDSFSFIGFLKILVKTAIMRPIALLSQPHENKLLITLIHELMMSIQEYQRHIQSNKILPEGENKVQSKKQLADDEQIQIQKPMQQQKEVFSAKEIERFKHQSQKFKSLVEVSKHISDAYSKTIKATIETLNCCFNYIQIDQNNGLQHVDEYYIFLINILTVRLERLLNWMLRIFPVQELKNGTFYMETVKDLLKLVMPYFECAVWAESKSVLQEIDNIQDVCTEALGSSMRYLMQNIDMQAVKAHIQAKLIQKTNIFSTVYQAILKFVYHLANEPPILKQNITQFIHKFIHNIKERHIKGINQSNKLEFKQIETLRLSLRVVSQFLTHQTIQSDEQQLASRQKVYAYCMLAQQKQSSSNLFSLLADILNNLEKHEIQKTFQLIDTHDNRVQVVKTIFTKIVVQKSKLFIRSFVDAHETTSSPDLRTQGVNEIRQYYDRMYHGYFAYVQVMASFIKMICGGSRFVLYKQEILGSVLDRNLEYTLFVQSSANPTLVESFHLEYVRMTKRYIDEHCNGLLQWAMANAHKYLHRLPLLIRRALHFERRLLKTEDSANSYLLEQQQIAHTNRFIQSLSYHFTRISLTLTGKRLDLKFKLKQPKMKKEEINVDQQIRRLSNYIIMIGQMVKLITVEEYFQPNHPHISPNYIYSILRLIKEALSNYKVSEFKSTNKLIHASFWLIEVYLQYYEQIKLKKLANKQVKKAENRKLKKMKKKQLKRMKYEQQALQKEAQPLQENIPQDKNKTKRKKTKKRKHKQLTNSQQQPKGLLKSGSKSNLLDKSQANNTNKSQKSQAKTQNSRKQLHKVVLDYIQSVLRALSNSPVAIINNDTLSYILYFICRNMKKNIIQNPPYNSLEINMGEILPDLLRVKINDIKIPGYHYVLCKMGLQLFDQSHIKIDFQLALKRYFYQNLENGADLLSFIRMLKENFKEISQSTSQLIEIVCLQGEGQNIKVTKHPFIKENYDEFLKDTQRKFKVQLKQGVDLHLVNFKHESSLKRKPSANEQSKVLKVSDYSPDTALFTFIENLITHSIRLLFTTLDKVIITYIPLWWTLDCKNQFQPFTIRTVLQTLQYLSRQSPSLSPFIAKFKCKKIIINQLNAEYLSNRQLVADVVMSLLNGTTEVNENMQQIGFLSVLIRLFSPLVVNAISGLVFELCLDSTPLIQVSDTKTGKNTYLPFSSVVRAKVVEQIQNILFEKTELKQFFRKLCLLNLLTVLINIREMSKLLIQNSFISKIFKAFERMKNELTDNRPDKQWTTLFPGNYVTHVLSPFYLSPLSILQEINISLHYNKKMLKGDTKKISIKNILDRASINSQLIHADAFKKYKFKDDWPFNVKKNVNILQVNEPEEYTDENISDDSDLSESYESIDSEDEDMSSYMRYQQLMDQPPGQDEDSYISMSQPHEHLFNQQWDYSNHEDRNEGELMDYPNQEDRVVQLSMSEGDDHFSRSQGQSQEGDIQDYLDNQVVNSSRERSGSIIDELSMSNYDSSLMAEHPQNQFTVNKVRQDQYYKNVASLINFERIQSIMRISRAQKKQVHLLRFLLQLSIIEDRVNFNRHHPRKMTPHEIKQQKVIQDNRKLLASFKKDKYITLTEYVEYIQIYRYDHYQKQMPKLSEEIEKHFIDHVECTRFFRRRGGFLQTSPITAFRVAQRPQLIQIVPGWNITEVIHEQPQSHSNMDENSYAMQLREERGDQIESSGSHINIQSEHEEQQPAEGEERDDLEEMLRNSNLNMTVRQFMRLDPQLQHDIILNITEEAHQLFHQPHNSPADQPQPENSPPLPINVQFNPEDNIMQAEEVNQEEPIAEQPQGQGQPMAGQQNRVDEVYRKMSVQHSKKVSKDLIQALNKQGKNDSKFYQIQQSELQHLLQAFFITQQADHSKFPYPLIESLCINTRNLSKIISSLITFLHLYPSRFYTAAQISLMSQERRKEIEQGFDHYSQKKYPQKVLRILHLLSHLTKSYSISMSFLNINKEPFANLRRWQLESQSQLSSFEMLILLAREKKVAQSPMILGFLIAVLDNITMHYFYKNVHKIVEKGKQKRQMENEDVQAIRVNKDLVYQLGELLQSDFVGDNLALVSKIIMRLSVQQHNLHNFIKYLEQLVKNLTDQALEEVIKDEEKQINQKDECHGHLKIVNIMSIFYEMVKAFETYPTSSERHVEVLASLRRIVQYDKLQELCERAIRTLCESTTTKQKNRKIQEVIDCFFILHEIAIITSSSLRPNKPVQDIHNNIAELGEIVQLRRSQVSQQQTLCLGKFNLTKLWKESVSNPNFKIYVNSNIKKKMSEVHGRRINPLDIPIIKIASETHLMSFDNKYALFKMELKALRGKDKYEMIHMSLKREEVFEDSFENFMSRSGEKLRGKLKIEFQDQQGEDAGGVTREWFQLLSREMFNPNYGLFRAGSGGHTYHPSSTSYVNDKHLDYFKFIGRIAGKALYDGYLLDAYFTPAFYKHILNLPITYHDMEQQDYQYFKSLTWIIENSPIEEYLEITFTYDCDNFGQIETKELIPNGANILVTEENKMQYVQLIAYAKMATSIKLQLQAFLTGLHELIPHRLLKIFTEKELEIMISGRPTIDIEDLRRHTELVNYMKNDPIIVWLFEVLESFDMELRTAFIQFVTGSSRVPVEGFKDLRGMNGVQRFNIHRQFQEERLPRAHTCFNQLDLPNYKSKQILIQKLMYAITQGKQGFGMI